MSKEICGECVFFEKMHEFIPGHGYSVCNFTTVTAKGINGDGPSPRQVSDDCKCTINRFQKRKS